MRIELQPEKISVEIDGVVFKFQAASQQDMVFAACLLDQIDPTKFKADGLNKDTGVRHVFSKLESFEGEVNVGGEAITPEKLRELVNSGKVQAGATLPICTGWAIQVLKAHGLLGAETKKDVTTGS